MITKKQLNHKIMGNGKVKSFGMAILLTLTFSISTATAQESVNTTGASISGNGGSASYSIGQVTYQTYSGTNGSLAAGVQQPYEISVVTAVEPFKEISLSLSAYPNPVADYLTLKVESEKFKDVSYRLYDMNGKLLQSQKMTDSQIEINMKGLAASTYFIKVMVENKEVKTFKIIKNKDK
jgi:hypothetical protein